MFTGTEAASQEGCLRVGGTGKFVAGTWCLNETSIYRAVFEAEKNSPLSLLWGLVVGGLRALSWHGQVHTTVGI